MDNEGSPDNPQDDGKPEFSGLWAALVRTLERSGESGFDPGEVDMALFEAAICLPLAMKFSGSNEEPLKEYLQDARVALSRVFRNAATHPAISNAPLENRDREADEYLKWCVRNELLVVAEKNPITREMRTRVREALRAKNPPVEEGVEGEDCFFEGNFGYELAGVPATSKATQTDIDDLETSLPAEKPSGYSGDVPCGLPTAGQIAELAKRVIEATGLGFSEDQLRALAHTIFSVPPSLANISLDEPRGEEDEPREISAGDLHPGVPGYEDAGAIAIAPEVEAAKREMFDIIARRESRTHKKSGTPVRDAFLYLQLHDGETLDDDKKITATLYEERTGISDATTLERMQCLQEDFRNSKVLRALGMDVIRAAIADIQSESEESFRKFWGLRPYSDK
jgi:hypothetical protein